MQGLEVTLTSALQNAYFKKPPKIPNGRPMPGILFHAGCGAAAGGLVGKGIR